MPANRMALNVITWFTTLTQHERMRIVCHYDTQDDFDLCELEVRRMLRRVYGDDANMLPMRLMLDGIVGKDRR